MGENSSVMDKNITFFNAFELFLWIQKRVIISNKTEDDKVKSKTVFKL